MARSFAIGVVILFLGLQLRAVDTFVLNEQATRFVNQRIEKKVAEDPVADPYAASFNDPFASPPAAAVAAPAKRPITPPRWLGYSFLSIGTILVLTCRLFR